MEEQNLLYIQSQERWQKEQELLIESLEANLLNSETMVNIHKRTAKLVSETIEFEKHNLKRNRELLEQWKLNNIPNETKN